MMEDLKSWRFNVVEMSYLYCSILNGKGWRSQRRIMEISMLDGGDLRSA
jgi:hypothetical protein